VSVVMATSMVPCRGDCLGRRVPGLNKSFLSGFYRKIFLLA
jgi:hypothetical protein